MVFLIVFEQSVARRDRDLSHNLLALMWLSIEGFSGSDGGLQPDVQDRSSIEATEDPLFAG